MKRNFFSLLAVLLMVGSAALIFVNIDGSAAQAQKSNPKFEAYRKAIKDAHQVDIADFKDKIDWRICRR